MVTESRDMSWDRVCVNTFFFGIFLFDHAASWTRSCVLEMSHQIRWCLRCISSCVMFSWCISSHSLLCLIKNKPQLSGPRWESRCPLIIFRAWLGILRSTEDISWSLRCIAYKKVLMLSTTREFCTPIMNIVTKYIYPSTSLMLFSPWTILFTIGKASPKSPNSICLIPSLRQ